MLALVTLLLAPVAAQSCLSLAPQFAHGSPAPGGGQLVAPSLPYAGTLGSGGRVVFVSAIAGSARNQAVMISSGGDLKPIAFGCGGAGGSGNPGGCGDPAPGGGTFAGFFEYPAYAPATNDAGDVLFLADLAGAGTPRAVFLFHGATGVSERIAAVGGPSPSGFTITALGLGTLDANGNAVFLARTQPGAGNANEILAWDAGVLSVVAREGSAGPGGTYSLVANGFAILPDNTALLVGGVPSRDAAGRVAHFASVTPTQATGLVLHTPGQAPVWIAVSHQPAPTGGAFDTFGAPRIAANGEIVFSSRLTVGQGFSAGVFAGVPGSLRTVLQHLTQIGTLTVVGFERSANPFSFTGRGGDVVLWVRTQRPDLTLGEAHVLARPNTLPEVLLQDGDTAPFGGTITALSHWPAIDEHGRVLHAAQIAQGPTSNMAWLSLPCGIPIETCTGKPSSLGCTPKIGSTGRASASGSTQFQVTAHALPSQSLGLCFYGSGVQPVPFQGGTLCVMPPLVRLPPQTSSGPLPSDCSGTLAVDFGAHILSGVDPALQPGAFVSAQWFIRDPADPTGFGSTMSDALAFAIGP
jgi:hypothetical protein